MKVCSEEQLRRAMRRARAGTNATANWGMSTTEAWVALEDAIDELLVLRSQVDDWVCRKCRLVFHAQGFCARCGECLVASVVVALEALRAEIGRLQARVDFLEEVTRVGLSLDSE